MQIKAKALHGLPMVVGASAVTLVALALWRAHAFDHWLVSSVVALDDRAILFLNRFARRSWAADTLLYLIDANPLGMAPLLMAVWWGWFKDKERARQIETREILMSGIIASFLVLPAVRALVVALPYRARPLHNPDLHFQLTYGMDPNRLLHWSSFPSDHAVLWFLLATTVFFVSRRLGVVLLAYSCVALSLARVYLGVHYPSDIFVGAVIGVGAARMCLAPGIRNTLSEQPMNWLQRWPGAFYAGFFVITGQMMEGFSSLNELETLVKTVLKKV